MGELENIRFFRELSHQHLDALSEKAHVVDMRSVINALQGSY